MENTNNSQPNYCSSTFVPSFGSGNREVQLVSGSNNNNNNYIPNPNQSHSQYSPPQQHQQLRQGSVASSAHHSATNSPFQSSFPMPRMNQTPAVDHNVHPSSYAQSMSSTGPPPHPATTTSSGYLDPSPYLNMDMREVIGMDMDPLPIGSNMDMDLGILSTDQHADLRLLQERERQRQLHSQQQEHQMALSTSSDPRNDGSKGRGIGGRKRDPSDEGSEPGNSGNRGGGRAPTSSNRKQRGRPRLDTKDENAADRRRTQIRLAQRAYRLRKETTISSLRSRVAELETAIDGMQNTFLELHDSVMSCLNKSTGHQDQIQPFGIRLKELTEKFLRLAKTALAEGTESAVEEDAEGESVHDDDGGHGAAKKRRRSRDDGSPDGGRLQTNGSTIQPYGAYQVTFNRDGGGSNNSGYNGGNHGGSGSTRNAAGALESSVCSGSEGHDSLFMNSFESNAPPFNVQSTLAPLSSPTSFNQGIPPELDSYSYSFHEATFSRRLHRAGLENAYRLLTSPNTDQRELARVFANTFCYLSKEDVENSIAHLLKATKDESLNLYDYPDLGQLPRRPLDYSEMLEKYSGFDKMAQSRSTVNSDMRVEAYKSMLKLGINQKYLRPDDVERMITEMGILSTTQTSLMSPNVEVVSSSPEESHTTSIQACSPKSMVSSPASSSGMLSSPPMSSNSLVHNIDGTSQDSRTSQSSIHSLSGPMRSSPPVIRSELFEEPHTTPAAADEVDNEHSVKVIEGVKKYVNMDVLVKELVNRGVCLGRFPGFKKSDVLTAVRLASTHVY